MTGGEPARDAARAGEPVRLVAGALAAVPHGFFGRVGQVGDAGMGAYRTVVRDRLCPRGSLVMLRQTHSALCVPVTDPWDHAARPEGDALVTDRPEIVLGIVTADCAPVLLADSVAGVVAAAHAGWRGALGGVIGNTVAAMERLGARRERIAAAIGPAIAQASYEVDEALRARFPADAHAFFAPGRPGRHQFDLPAYVADRLRNAGVGSVEDLAADTYGNPALFHSHRRASHQGRDDGGRQISAVGSRQAGRT